MSSQEDWSKIGGQKAAFVAFAKNPELVAVKTRLAATLGEEPARKLYIAFLEDCLAKLKTNRTVAHFLACYPDMGGKVLPDLAAKYDFKLLRQEGADLGERMLNCVKTLLESHSSVIVFGTDVPVLPIDGMEKPLEHTEDWDVLLGPSRDGGYWAFGANRLQDGVFDGIRWGSDTVFVETVKNCVKLGLDLIFVDVSEDVDNEESLTRLCEMLEGSGDEAGASRLALEELGLLGGRKR